MSSDNPKDRHYLKLQFWNKIFRKNGTEFQNFFESVMQASSFEFKKVKPHGNKGDGGNDGFTDGGVYYQVYAPESPGEKLSEAAEKMKTDFEKILQNWNKHFPITKFNFVFNDKDMGVGSPLLGAVADLKKLYPDIEFEILTPKNIENIFLNLPDDEILSLGFTIDSRKAVSNIHSYLDNLKIELDRDNGEFILTALEKIEAMVDDSGEDDIQIEFEILKCRALRKSEKANEAKEGYEKLAKKYPQDVRPLLYLAEAYLDENNYEKNEELLKKAEQIDDKHWLLVLEKMVRDYRAGRKIDISKINENDLTSNDRVKSDFCRLKSAFCEREGDYDKAIEFIDRAIQLNPNKFCNHDTRICVIEGKILSEKLNPERPEKIQGRLKEVHSVEKMIEQWGHVSGRNRVILNMRKINIMLAQGKTHDIEKLAKETFELVINCDFDELIEQVIVGILRILEIPNQDFERLLDYLQLAKRSLSDELGGVLIFQQHTKG